MIRWLALSLVFLAAGFAAEEPGRIEGIAVCRPDDPTENVVVSLTGDPLKVLKPPQDPVVMDQRNLLFVPRVLPILLGTTVVFPNSDPIRHNVFSASETRMFNLGTYSSGISRNVIFDKKGVVELLCNVHPEMSAYILVLETPHFTATESRGFFHLEGIDPGEYTLNFWCEHRGSINRKVLVKSGEVSTVNAVLHSDDIKVAGQETPANSRGR